MSPPLAAPLVHVYHADHLGDSPLHQVNSGLDSLLGPLKPGEITYVELPWKIMGLIIYQVVVEVIREEGTAAV